MSKFEQVETEHNKHYDPYDFDDPEVTCPNCNNVVAELVTCLDCCSTYCDDCERSFDCPVCAE